MALVIEQSNQAYEQRDKAQLEIAAIEQADRKDEDAYHQQMNELSDQLEEINQQLLNSTRRNQQPVVVDPVEEERKAAERREAARANEIARAEEEYAQQRKERMQNFEEAFRKISAATGINDVDELVRVFIENEEQNFSLFRYMNEQTAEIERLEDEINALQEEGERVRAEQGDGNDREEVAKIEKQIKAAIEQTAMYDAKCVEQQKLLDEVKDEIKVGMV
jgi:DNA repair exonuclease SbcCD ATPase subunit